MTCSIYYDLGIQGFGGWWFLLLGLSVSTLGILLFVGGHSISRGRLSKVDFLLKVGGATFAIGWIGISVYQTAEGYYLYRRLLETRSAGMEEHVSGVVGGFTPYELDKPSQTESFRIGDHIFSFSPNDIRAGFRQIRAKGSPVQNGIYLRVGYIGSAITRLETCYSFTQ
jgi:hypothetical protein